MVFTSFPFLVWLSHLIAINKNSQKFTAIVSKANSVITLSKAAMPSMRKRRRQLEALRDQQDIERNSVSVPPPSPASKTTTPPDPGYSLKEELEGGEESFLHCQTASGLRADVHWDEQSTDGKESEEELEMARAEDNVEFV